MSRDGTGEWTRHTVGEATQADRFEAGDVDGDGRPDVVVSEERYPGSEPNARLYWYEAPADPTGAWTRHEVVTTYSLNNLDVADMDGDGDPDIVSPAWDDYQNLHLWRNDAR